MKPRADLTTVCVLTIAFLAGCGTGRYNDLMQKRMEQLKREAPFVALQAPAEIPGTSIKIGIPKRLPRFITPETDDPTGLRGKISKERIKFFPFDAKGTYVGYDAEVEQSAGGPKIPVACQIAVLPKSDFNVLEALKKKFPDVPLQEEQVSVDAFQGGNKLNWTKVRMEAPTGFDIYPVDVNAPIEFKNLPSIIEVWWHQGEHYLTILTWRVPADLNEQIKLIEMAPLTAATLIEGPPPAPPAEEAEKPAAAPAA